jgi:hypothetical protein
MIYLAIYSKKLPNHYCKVVHSAVVLKWEKPTAQYTKRFAILAINDQCRFVMLQFKFYLFRTNSH